MEENEIDRWTDEEGNIHVTYEDPETGATMERIIPGDFDDEEEEDEDDDDQRKREEKEKSKEEKKESDDEYNKSKENEGSDGENPEGEQGNESPEGPEGAEGGEAAGEGAEVGAEAGAEAGTEAGAEAAAEAAVEGAAEAAAEEGAVAAGATVGWPVVLGCLAILVIVIILMIIFIVFMGLRKDSASFADTSLSTNTSDLCMTFPKPDPKSSAGFAELPSNSPDYKDVSTTSWGTPETVAMLQAVAKFWNAKHPDIKITYNDLSKINGGNFYPPHRSHQKGIDVDINNTGGNKKSFIMSHSPYDKNVAIELLKLYINTRSIDVILYNDSAVISAVNDYAEKNNLPGRVKSYSGHDNHYHLRITPGAYSKACGY